MDNIPEFLWSLFSSVWFIAIISFLYLLQKIYVISSKRNYGKVKLENANGGTCKWRTKDSNLYGFIDYCHRPKLLFPVRSNSRCKHDNCARRVPDKTPEYSPPMLLSVFDGLYGCTVALAAIANLIKNIVTTAA